MNVGLHSAASTGLAEFSFSLCIEGTDDFDDLSPCKPVKRRMRSLKVVEPKEFQPHFIDPFMSQSPSFSKLSQPPREKPSTTTVIEIEANEDICIQIEDPIDDCDETDDDEVVDRKRQNSGNLISPKKVCLPEFHVSSPSSEDDTDADSPGRPSQLDTEPQSDSGLEFRVHRPTNSVLGIPFGRSEKRPQLDGTPTHSSPVRRRSNRSTRLNGLPRRTQSLFATPRQLLQEQLTVRSPIERLSTLDLPNCPIPSFRIRQDTFRRIDSHTLCRLVDGEFSEVYSEIVIVDCRFEYEFAGGHIRGAINVNSKQQLEQLLFRDRECSHERNVLLVFHCEHSAYRSPMLANHLRSCDRELNAHDYPKLFYPDVVVLDGGYNQFFNAARDRCEPQNYVGMNHQEHQQTCEKELSKFRDLMKPRKSVSTSQLWLKNDLEFKFPPLPQANGACRSASLAVLECANEWSRRTTVIDND